jgi:cob(I)alamin adenosyltransferase
LASEEQKKIVRERRKKGLIIVHTGDGKGKTTAALGIALRAVGHDFKVFVGQFIKGSRHYGELVTADRLKEWLTICPMGEGFTWETKSRERDTQKAHEAWALFKEKILGGEYQLVILDEINIAIHYGYLDVDQVVETLRQKPVDLHVILTGRNAHPKVVELADLVTEMKLVKHPFREQGITAQKGIEF